MDRLEGRAVFIFNCPTLQDAKTLDGRQAASAQPSSPIFRRSRRQPRCKTAWETALCC